MLTNIEFENYRVFKNRQRIVLRPITIIFGKNNSGKSALLKLPLLVNSFVQEEPKIFSKEINGVTVCKRYADTVYGKGNKVVRFLFSNESGSNVDIRYLVEKIGALEKPLLQKHIPQDLDLSILRTQIDYIGAIRPNEIEATRDIDSEEPVFSGADGDDTYQYLLRDYNTAERTLYNKVSKWYETNFDGWGIRVQEVGNNLFTIGMGSGNLQEIPIQDCGTGIRQSLPIVIRACKKCEEPTLIVFEEPETHLNPGAHANLSQLIAESIDEDPNKRYLIETHSQTFILRLRRMLAEKKLRKDDVALYYVEYNLEEESSVVNQIEINEDGTISKWPKGMFEEVLGEVIAINKRRGLQ